MGENVSSFVAKLKQLTVRSRDQFAVLEFAAEEDQQIELARVLITTGRVAVLFLSVKQGEGVTLDGTLSQLRFDGGGRSWAKFTVDLDRVPDVVEMVNKQVSVEVR